MTKKRVLIYSQAFFPDHSGIPVYSSDFAFYCAENGYDVDVITGFPFYPQWRKRKEDEYKLFSKEIVKGVTIYRGYLYVPNNPSSLQRIIHELTLVFFAFLNSWRVKNPDIIVVFTTPILLGVLGAFMNIFWRRKLVINVQDFQAEAAHSLGMLKESFMLRMINKLEIWSYRKANFVSSISFSMQELLIEKKGINKDKTILWPNWIQEKEYHSEDLVKETFRKKNNFSATTRLIGYAGNVGKKQGLTVFIDAAGLFSDITDLVFLIIGEGSDLENLKAYATEKKASNVLFMPFLNKKEYQEFLLDVDAVFISQVKVPFDIYFPSKLLGIMDMGKLLIINADPDSELYKTTKNNNLALVSEYGNVGDLQENINLVIRNDTKTDLYKVNAKEFVSRFDRNVVLKSILKTLE